MWMDHWSKYSDGANLNTWIKTSLSATFPTTNPTRTDLESNPEFCGDRQATNRVSYGTLYNAANPVSRWIELGLEQFSY